MQPIARRLRDVVEAFDRTRPDFSAVAERARHAKENGKPLTVPKNSMICAPGSRSNLSMHMDSL